MAGTQGINFLIGAHLQSTVGSAFASLRDKLRATQQSFRNTEKQSTALGNVIVKQQELADALRRAREQMATTGAVDKSLSESIGKLSRQYGDAARSAGVYGQSLERIKWAQREMLRESQRQKDHLQNLQRIQTGRDTMQAGRDQRASAYGKATGIVASAAAIAQPLRIGMEFDEAMSKVRAISGAKGADFDAMRAKARELGATTVWSAKEAAEGMTFLSMAGFKTHETIAAMPGMLSLASAGAMDLGATADIASNILSGFGFEAEKMDYVADVLAKTFTKSNTSIASLGESMKYCAPVAANAGQSFQDVAAMIGKLGDAGIQGSMAGTGLNAIIGRMAAPPKEAASALKKLGVSVADSNGKMRALPDVFADIEKAMGKFSEKVRIELAKALYGAEHFAKGFVLQIQSVNGEIQKMSAGLDEHGYSNKIAAQQTDNLAGDLKQLNSAYQEVCISLFEQLNPAMRQAMGFITPTVQAIGVWIKENPRLVQGITLIGGALVGLKAAGFAFSILASYRKSFGGGMDVLRGQVGRACDGVRGAFGRMRAELTRPVGFKGRATIIQGVNSMGTGFDRLRNSISQTRQKMNQFGMDSVRAGVKAMGVGVKAGLSGAAAATGRAGWNMLRLGVQGFGAALKVAFGPMSLLIMGLSLGVDYVIEHWDKIQPYFEALWEGVKAIFSSVMGWLQPIIDKIVGAVKPVMDAASWVGNKVGGAVSGIRDKFVEGWDSLMGNDKEKARKEKAAAEDAERKRKQEELTAKLPPEAREQARAQMRAQNGGVQTVAAAAIQPPVEAAIVPPREAAVKTPGQMRKEDSATQKPQPAKNEKSQKFEQVVAQAAQEEPKRQGKIGAGQSAPQIVQPQVQVSVNVTQNGVPDQTFATGVMNAIRARQSELESMISEIVNNQARLAYGG
ncbi:MAG: phage tail tape measure protein [Desulfovibrio sp.]|jgi:TP901 family phage tail tape measure protein|nr:phage tail tape measure protein [Desulfovibrio sp.]